MYKATIVRDRNGTYHIRISKARPETGGDVTVIEVLDQRPSEDREALKERAIEYVRSLPK